MIGGLHPRADVDRMYVSRSMGGHGLLSVEDTIMCEHLALYHYLKDHKDALMKKVLSSGVETPDDVKYTPDAFKNHIKMTNFQNWRDKPMHGQYVCNLHDNNSAHSFEWLIRSDLKIETESLIFAAQ